MQDFPFKTYPLQSFMLCLVLFYFILFILPGKMPLTKEEHLIRNHWLMAGLGNCRKHISHTNKLPQLVAKLEANVGREDCVSLQRNSNHVEDLFFFKYNYILLKSLIN